MKYIFLSISLTKTSFAYIHEYKYHRLVYEIGYYWEFSLNKYD